MNNGPVVQRNWDWRAAGNFIGGGTGSGLLVAAAMAALWYGADARNAMLAGILLTAAGLFLVWLELGRPWRFLNVFRNPHTSWMSRESYLAVALFSLVPVAYWTASPVVQAGVALVAGLFLYSQARMLQDSRGIAAWRAPEIVPLILMTGLAEGAGALLVIWTLTPALRAGVPALPLVALVLALLVLRQVFWQRYRRAVNGSAPVMTIEVVESCRLPFNFFGSLLPALLLLSIGFLGPTTILPGLAAGICLVLSGWSLKFVLVNVAACNQGFALAHSPARGAGTPGPGTRPGWRRPD